MSPLSCKPRTIDIQVADIDTTCQNDNTSTHVLLLMREAFIADEYVWIVTYCLIDSRAAKFTTLCVCYTLM